jgi:hypothetical protein
MAGWVSSQAGLDAMDKKKKSLTHAKNQTSIPCFPAHGIVTISIERNTANVLVQNILTSHLLPKKT